MNEKLLIAIIALLLILVGWLLLRSPSAPQPPAVEPSAVSATPTKAAALPAAAASPSPGYRLAGTVVGDVQYAIIEAPDGSNRLYHVDDDIPGLGTLLEIHGLSAKFRGTDGEFELPLLAAPSPTAGVAVETYVGADDLEYEDDGAAEDYGYEEYGDEEEYYDDRPVADDYDSGSP